MKHELCETLAKKLCQDLCLNYDEILKMTVTVVKKHVEESGNDNEHL